MVKDKEILIKTNNIAAAYDSRMILKGISIEIYRKETVALIGPNGAGKSTFLKILAGILPPISGNVLYLGEDITCLDVCQRVKRGIGFLMQGNEIFTNLKVRENLFISALHMSRSNVEETIYEIFKVFPILSVMKEKRAGLLSGGERKMLALAMILMYQPKKLLLLDEPSAGLSPKFTKIILEKIIELKNKLNISILLVEQNLREALRFSDRVYLLKEGLVVDEKSSGDCLKDTEELRKIFF